METSNRKTSLVIMAAGLGSRFGKGIKQLTSFGPSGEIIMDYSIYDALQAGFDKVVFILRRDLADEFREIIGRRIEKQVEVAYAFQNIEDLPEGFCVPAGRVKPWGTGQAVLAARDVIDEPFKIHDYLTDTPCRTGIHQPYRISMAGFVLNNTLSEHGGVTRGLCEVDEAGRLEQIIETKNIIRHAGGAAVLYQDGTMKVLNPDMPVSMNMWGFQPDFIDELKAAFPVFLRDIVGGLLRQQKALIDVLPISDHWFGVTYQEDVPAVKESFRKLIAEGQYPERLWG